MRYLRIWQGKDLVLSLGPIDDMDRTYFNGKLVGATEASGFWQTDRIYNIPSTLAKAGNNQISVRVIDTQGGGGIFGKPEKMKISAKNDSKVIIPLNGEWKYQPVAEYKDNKFYVIRFSKK